MKKYLIFFGVLILLGVFFYRCLRTTDPAPRTPSPNIAIPEINYDSPAPEPKADLRPARLNEFFKSRKSPLEGKGQMFVDAADTFKSDWRLLAAISVRESSAGLHACGFNVFGWDSCNGYNFKSYDEAITYVSWRLVDSPYYAGKTDYEKLKVYNSVIPTYADEVISIMQMIQRDGL